jgi:alpha-tubulin suppressor-like RCC1 family protein
LFSVGSNRNGCLGDGTTNNCQIIKQIDYFSNIFISDVVCGYNNCLAISKDDKIFFWGTNFAENFKQLTPVKIFKFYKNGDDLKKNKKLIEKNKKLCEN